MKKFLAIVAIAAAFASCDEAKKADAVVDPNAPAVEAPKMDSPVVKKDSPSVVTNIVDGAKDAAKDAGTKVVDGAKDAVKDAGTKVVDGAKDAMKAVTPEVKK